MIRRRSEIVNDFFMLASRILLVKVKLGFNFLKDVGYDGTRGITDLI